MARAGVLRSLTIAGAVVWLCGAPPAIAAAGPVQPASIQPIGTIHTIELPGGVEGIRRAIGDRRPTPPASVVVEMTRRFHGGTADAAGDDPILARLRAWLRTCAAEEACAAASLPPDRVPKGGGRKTASRLRVFARRSDATPSAPPDPAVTARDAMREYHRGVEGRSLIERLGWYRLAARRAEAARQRAKRMRKSEKIGAAVS